MTFKAVSAALAALTLLGCSISAHAAPDNTLGMALMSAVVDSDGTLARGSGVTGVTTIGNGIRVVAFDRNVRDCTFTASVGRSGTLGSEAPGVIDVVAANNNVNGVYVDIADLGGVPANRGFHLIVFCHK